MPPPISAAQGSDDDQSPSSSGPPVEISDSDLEKDDQETEIEVEEEEIENDNEEEEYEEIIVVEEEEIEEEVEVEEDDMSDSSKEANVKNVGQDTEFEGTDRQLGLRSTPGRSSLGLPSNSLVEDGVCNSQFSGPLNEPVKLQEELHVNYEDSKCLLKSGTTGENGSQRSLVKNDTEALMIKKKSKEISKHYSDSMAHFFNDEAMAAETTSPSSIAGNEVSNALAIKDSLGMETNGILDSEVDVNPMEKRSGDKEQTTSRFSRLVTLEKRTRSLSPSAEFEDQNKRPAVICDFFSKGWCIRGSSCTFLHIKNKTVNAKEQLEGDAAAANFSKRDQFDEGLKNITEKPKFPGFPDLMASSIGNSAAFSCQFSSERILALENGESQRLHRLDDKHKSLSLQREDLSQGFHSDTQQFPSSKDDHGVSSSKNVGIENLRRSWPASDYGSYASPINRGSSPSFQSRLLPELRYSSSFSSVTSSNNHRENSFSYLSSLDNLTYIRDQFVQGTSLDGSLSSSVMLPSQQISAWKGPSFSFSSSLNTSPFGSQKLSHNDRNYHASRSLRQSASLLFGSDRETSLLTSVSRDPLHYAEHKAKISSNDWEPSIPFRPSFSVTHTMASSPGSQYDPVRDSIDLSTTGYRLPFKFSFVTQERSNLNSSHQSIYDNSLSKTLGSECHNDKSTVSLHGRFHENVLDKNCSTPGKVMGGTCVVSGQKGTMPKEENASSSGHLSDVPNTSKIDVDRDSRHEYDAPRHKQDFKVDRVRQKNEMDVDQKTDGESRVLRHFRAALIDFVKELLRPTWREGHLSKDAHNTIAKKAVEKVLRTLQPHQIPTTVESTRQYLSSSQPKIAKLVEGYCTKYGKS
ncbi:protein FRIGIDA-ESSENTIAL 1 isoform X2 [Hevea brasiliensis]|uniref:protein FRIGIDA-ESSENTIAL 1 isoform X2 n=1 Tax=Hevea brasiliensis TaxID=3981 RepID=UPI0025EC0813|nr:protein FRIGIDA-ESSENTIAL 1 isoform X2 [Hevea brasiliensis]